MPAIATIKELEAAIQNAPAQTGLDDIRVLEQALNRLAPFLPPYTHSSLRGRLASMRRAQAGPVTPPVEWELPLKPPEPLVKPPFSPPQAPLPGGLGPSPAHSDQTPIVLHAIRGAEIEVARTGPAARLTDLQDCRVRCGPVRGSVQIEGCSGCSLDVAGQQVRLSRCTDCRLHVYTATSVIMEESVGCSVEPARYAADPERWGEALAQYGFDRTENRWEHVCDLDTGLP